MIRHQKAVLIFVFSVIAISLLFFLLTLLLIKRNVVSFCRENQNITKGSCRLDMEKILTDEKTTFHNRNHAVWTLGQLADKNSLAVLEKYYTGKIPSKESQDNILSQYELYKALKWCRGGNITSWMYRKL